MQENENNQPIIQKSIEEHFAAFFERHQKKIDDILNNLTTQLNKIRISAQPFIDNLLKIDWQSVLTALRDMPAASREAMEKAAERGWFFTWQHSLQETFTLIKELKQSKTEDEVDEILEKHYRKNLDFYADALSTLYPGRSIAIKAAVSAHKNLGIDGYLLSVPVFIAQADGILADISGLKMPLGKDQKTGKAKVSTWADEQLDSDQRSKDIIAPLLNLNDLDILKSSNQRNNTFNALNRHQVMHGEVSNYGTELNSLKAFSLLAFCGVHIPSYLVSNSQKQVAPVMPTPTST